MEMANSQPLHGLYGSQINRENAVGYCRKHGAHLTTATLKNHACLKKGCHHLKKHDDNPQKEKNLKRKRK